MRHISIIIGKLIMLGLKAIGSSGSALPGLIIEKLQPGFLQKQLADLEHGVVIVTGTNGKTTTTKALVFLLEQAGLRVVTNPTGSNLTRGVIATLLKYSRWTGSLPYDIAVLELDEAFSRKFADIRPPEFVLALNVMRDQLDRYGEIDTTAEMIGETVAKAQKAVVLNADDNRITDLAKMSSAAVSYFSVAPSLKRDIPNEDELHNRLKPPKKPKRKKQKSAVTLMAYDNGSAVFGIEGKKYPVQLNMPGIHNAVNVAAALAMAQAVYPQMKPQFMVPSLEHVTSAFGRGESLLINGKQITLSLVKNPSGFRQAIKSFSHEDFDTMAFVINDEFADGRDVSWLWDVDFTEVPDKADLLCSGSRAYDMALRLSYDEKTVDYCETAISKAIAELLNKTEERAIVYCTYTAMLALRKQLAAGRGSMGDVW